MMPVRKVKGGYKIDNVKGEPKSREAAIQQLAAIHAAKAARGGEGGRSKK